MCWSISAMLAGSKSMRYGGLESIGQYLQCLQGQSPCAMVVAGMYWSISAMLAGPKSMRCGGLECVGQYLQCLQGQTACAALVARMLAFGGSDAWSAAFGGSVAIDIEQ